MTLKGFMTIILVDLLLPVAVIFNIYLYFYPVLYQCAFPRASDDRPADFRLLTIADPQIEGDTVLRKYRHVSRTPEELAQQTLSDRIYDQSTNAAKTVKYYAKSLDLWGNDRYLKHVYRVVKQLTYPTHITVLGDLLGSQWISDEEFARRGERFWNIFPDGEKVTDSDLAVGTVDGPQWVNKIMTMAGNHDIGYAGDMNRPRVDRFEKMFGPVNYKLNFHPVHNTSFPMSDPAPELRIVVLNSLALDTPIQVQGLADDAYGLIDRALKNKSLSATQASILLTHLPFWKPDGVCVDGPEVKYFEERYGGGIRSQNFISEVVSNLLKGWIFGYPSGDDFETRRKSRGVVMTGHDHEGCDVTHWWDQTPRENALHGHWEVSKTKNWTEEINAKMAAMHEPPTEAIREVTVKSVMGEYGGNVGLLSAWYEWETQEWKFGYSYCELGIQHIWWTVHGVNVGCAVWLLVLTLVFLKDTFLVVDERKKKAALEKKTK
ncbi:hypothetical protein EDC01DRAFT_695341 [Geopyxis carbonaria]|nr:hypothetical protein EDC01DRAFT_695341 [Geopyxis carbonaria]